MTGPTERIATGAVLLACPIALLLVSRGGQYTELAAFSPMFFPSTVLWCWIAVAGLCLAGDLLHARRARAARAEGAGKARAARAGMSGATAARIAAVVAAMGLYVALVTRLGFLLSSIGFTVATLLTLGNRSWPMLLGYGVLMPGALFVLFNHALGLPLPTSPFSYLF